MKKLVFWLDILIIGIVFFALQYIAGAYIDDMDLKYKDYPKVCMSSYFEDLFLLTFVYSIFMMIIASISRYFIDNPKIFTKLMTSIFIILLFSLLDSIFTEREGQWSTYEDSPLESLIILFLVILYALLPIDKILKTVDKPYKLSIWVMIILLGFYSPVTYLLTLPLIFLAFVSWLLCEENFSRENKLWIGLAIIIVLLTIVLGSYYYFTEDVQYQQII